MKRLTSLFFTLALVFFCNIAAAETEQTPETIKAACFTKWLEKVEEVKDKAEFQYFGDQYCSCIAQQSLPTPVVNMVQICHSRVVLQGIMASLKDDLGMEDITIGDIYEYCQDRWALITPVLNDQEKLSQKSYCLCAKKKLFEVVQSFSKYTEDSYLKKIDETADACIKS